MAAGREHEMDKDAMREDFMAHWPRGHGMGIGPDGGLAPETLGEWVHRCCTARTDRCPDQPDVFRELWEDADYWEEFLRSVRFDRRLRFSSQGWAEIAKAEWWPALAAIDERGGWSAYETESDRGGLLLTDIEGTCGVLVPNGYGDGRMRAIVCRGDEANTDVFADGPYLEGTWRIMAHDCADLGDECVAVVEGPVSTYFADGIVVLVERGGR